ncbi:PatB family C-S lyase [Seohaeicola saemankumensis]|nr:PatB family C-S lyase [Seohaeicola saemankumensis]MCA0872701.1 PatB family C-S lyase [Seohaeicola saemankumensis]
MTFDFDTPVEWRGTFSSKWDKLERVYGIPADEGLAMWVADMDFRTVPAVQERARRLVDQGAFTYYDNGAEYIGAITWWMQARHGWQVEPDWVFTTAGLVNAVGLCLDTFTEKGDGVVLFTPVYHAFARAIRAAGREVVECPLAREDGQYRMDFEAWDAQMTGAEKALILCSPHNPGGRVWTRAELQGVADFAKRHDLLLISDEIHHDLVYPGYQHIPMPLADPSVVDRLIMLTAPSKTFNVAGLHTGHVTIADPELRQRFGTRLRELSLAGNSMGQAVTAAAYSPEGAEWVDALMHYLDGNRALFEATIAEIPGLSAGRMEATYLSWVDFAGTGMERAEFTRRVEEEAKIATNHGPVFGTGGDSYLRFNIATRRALVEEACDRLRRAFADLQ